MAEEIRTIMDTHIIGLGTANPPLRVAQAEIYRAYLEHIPLSDKAKALLKRFMIDNRSIAFRHLGMDQLTDALQDTQDELIARYQKFAVPTALDAARQALEKAGLAPGDVDVLVINTCTGYLCPGLTSYVAEALSLNKHVRPFDLMGMGCGGAIPNLETGYNFLQAHPDSHVLSIAVEVCSATIFFSDEPDVLVSNAIFGDGAAAAVLTNRSGAGGPRLRGFAAGLFPEHRKYLRYITQDSRLKNVLSGRVPVLGARNGQWVIERLLSEQRLSPADIDHWIVHPGGDTVLQSFERTLKLPPGALEASWTVLHDYGNMSSASVLFVLQEMLKSKPQPGSLGLMCSFGAGFSAHAALLEFS